MSWIMENEATIIKCIIVFALALYVVVMYALMVIASPRSIEEQMKDDEAQVKFLDEWRKRKGGANV